MTKKAGRLEHAEAEADTAGIHRGVFAARRCR